MDSLFGAEGSLIVRFVVAFVIVLALIGLTFWLIRRFGTARVGNGAQRGRQPRLAVIDAAPVDGRRRLVLVRRDNVEHLLLIGGPSDFVVEQNIVRAVPVNPPRDMPVPRAEGSRTPETARPQAFDEDSWTPPAAEPPRPAFNRPDPLARAPRPEPRQELRPEPRPFAAEPLVRAPLPPGIAPRSIELICDTLSLVVAARSLRDQSRSTRNILMRCPRRSRRRSCGVRPSPKCSIAFFSVCRNCASENGFAR